MNIIPDKVNFVDTTPCFYSQDEIKVMLVKVMD